MAFTIDDLAIVDSVLAKIESGHRVTFDEVSEVCFSARKHVRRGREGLYKVFGQTKAGRYLLVVIAQHPDSWYVVTARDMTESERRSYRAVL